MLAEQPKTQTHKKTIKNDAEEWHYKPETILVKRERVVKLFEQNRTQNIRLSCKHFISIMFLGHLRKKNHFMQSFWIVCKIKYMYYAI